MPEWMHQSGRATGNPQTDGNTRFTSLCGSGLSFAGNDEVRREFIARDSYTWDRLYVRIITNTVDENTTYRSRINQGDGNQLVTVGAAATGAFEDNVNTDSLTAGDDYCWETDTQASTVGLIEVTLITSRLATGANTTPVLGFSYHTDLPDNSTYWIPLIGYQDGLNEHECQITFRVTATISNMKCYIYANSVTDTTVVVSRINAGDGNQTFNIAALASGAFEDVVNNDAINIGDEVCHEIDVPLGGIAISLSLFSSITDSDGRQTGTATGGGGYDSVHSVRYTTIEGTPFLWGAEAEVQSECRADLDAQNMFVNVSTNDRNGASVLILKINGGDGTITVTVPAATTGFFEDLVNMDQCANTDLINWEVDTTASDGGFGWFLNAIVFEQAQYTGGGGGAVPSSSMAGRMVAGRFI